MNFPKKSRIIKKNSRNFPKKLKDLKKLKVLEAMCLRLPPKNWAKKGPDIRRELCSADKKCVIKRLCAKGILRSRDFGKM